MRKIIITLLVCLFILTSWAAPKAKMPPVLVNVIQAKQVAWQPKVESTGTLVADQGITVAPDISGRITAIYFKSGDYVKVGTPLVTLFSDILQAQLQASEADLALSQLKYERDRQLILKKAIAQSDFDAVAAEYKKNKAQVARVKAELSQTTIRAPFSGYLGIRLVSIGDYVSAGTKIVHLQDTDPMYIDFSVPEVLMNRVKVGQTIVVTGDAYANQQFKGSIVAKDSLVNPNTRTILLRARIPNKDNKLIAGAFMVVNVLTGEPKQVVTIPQTAVIYSQAGDYVYRVINQHAIKTPIKIGERGQANIIVLQGLKANDTVITAGLQKIHDKARVKIAP